MSTNFLDFLNVTRIMFYNIVHIFQIYKHKIISFILKILKKNMLKNLLNFNILFVKISRVYNHYLRNYQEKTIFKLNKIVFLPIYNNFF